MSFKMKCCFLLLLCPIVFAGCSDGEKPSSPSANIQSGGVADDYSLAVEATEVETNQIELLVNTNIPGTIELMASINLANQALNDTYIGKSRRVQVSKGRAKIRFDVSDLPSGQYDAEVNFNPRWGFKDSESKATGISSELAASQAITIGGSGESAQSASDRNNNQKWVMENVVIGTHWNANEWKDSFGSWTEFPVTSMNPKVIKNYYFPALDMTIIVNVLKREVVTWRMGKDGL